MTVRLLRRPPADERGAVAIMVAVLASVLFITAAMVVDLGLARDTERQAQNAADASALAAANVLYPASTVCSQPVGGAAPCFTDAVNAATGYAAVNYGVTGPAWATCSDARSLGYRPDATVPCVSFDSASSPTRVRVLLPTRVVEMGLGAMAGVESIPVTSRAVAGARKGVSVTCGLCFTGSVDTKKFKARVDGGGIAVSGYVDLHPGGVPWTALSIQYGGDRFTGPVPSQTPEMIAAFDDPWAGNLAVPPSTSGLTPRSSGANPCSAGPGIYDSYEFKNDCTFATSGLYVFTGPLESKNVTITAPNVTLYFTCGTRTAPSPCAPGTSGGYLDLKNGDLRLTAPTSGVRAKQGIIYDRSNQAPLDLQGNGISNVVGAVYAPASTLNYNGTSDVVVTGGPVVLAGMTGNGATGVWVKSSEDVTIRTLPGEVSLAE